MVRDFFRLLEPLGIALALAAPGGFVSADPSHGIAMYGEPALPPDFVSLPYVNPDAPKGGRIVSSEVGGFDSLNPFILKGNSVYGQRYYGYESLMGRSYDEPFTLYGLLAESVETGPDREWVEFTLRPKAHFSDGSPVTVEDVLWSMETLGTLGHPRYQGAWTKVASAEAVDERTVRFTFNTPDRELPLILGLRPILKKVEGDQPFDQSSLEAPIGSGPYVIGAYEPGRFMTLVKDPDWWGEDLPFNRGQHNIGEIRYEWFGDADVAFEAFRAGELSANRELNLSKWRTAYDFPAVRSGDVVLSEIPHERPGGMRGLVMNTRRAPFDDWRVRDALIHAFNFEFINDAINGGEEPRIGSYYTNSVLAMSHGPAEGKVKDLLEPYADQLLPGALEGYALPVSDGTEANRSNTRKALRILQQAGWTVQDGVMKKADGEALEFDILLRSGATQTINIAELYAQQLKRIGVVANIVTVDSAQYTERTDNYDFDMAYYVRLMSLSPGNEQTLYWGSEGVTKPGTRNWMGMDNPVVEDLIDTMLNAEDQDDFQATVKALDRVLTTGRYVIPIWYSPVGRIAHKASLKYPEDKISMYGDWIGFMPDVWWVEE
ncbi:extracellular solute-binding protein [Tropicimonas isoalkanivorans]|uniref:Peptide/nickel transport system substrate-binding protein n=1 Tax=Tropicimonas isoalkanivorans TaxID=441112 RepID=A0A1I1D9F1_9RHOB|nr:extracellular solute-binding protein [Tropicimonas isoalkanivorans]SFB70992.1 peptide/nickel transport system substrate-binding protein [Tropicimonas isoalkanivorans]